MKNRRIAQRLSLCLAALGIGFAAWLHFRGGFDLVVGRIAITSNEPMRPLILAIVALVGYVLAGGRLRPPSREAVGAAGRAVSPQVVAVGLAAVVLAAAGIWGSRAAGGSDSYGYVSQAYRWLSGDLKQPMPWTEELPWPSAAASFQPLGYNRRSADTTLVPVYSPGLPLLMAGFISLAGACGAFLVVPLCGAVAVFATYHLGRSVASAWAGAAGAWFLATSPTFLQAVMQPMSDVPVTMAWVLAFAFAARGTTWAALAAGAATSWAVLIRVNLAPLAAAVLLWFAVRGWRNRSSGAAACWPPVVYALASVPGMIIAGALNLYLNGSPFLSGYGDNSYLFSSDWSTFRRTFASTLRG